MTVGHSEAETFWVEFLRSLARRGLRGVKLVVSDAHEGLKAAINKVLGATWQRCRVHFMRNALAYAGKTQRRIVSAWIGTAFAQDDAAAAKKQWRDVADQARPRVPKLATLMDDAEADVLAYMNFPAYLELSPGSSESPGLREDDSLAGSAQLEFQDVVEKSKESISRLNDLAKRLDHFIAMVEEGKGTLPMLLKDRALYDNLTDASKNLSLVLNKVDKGNGTLGRFLFDDKLYAKLESSANNIKEFSDGLNESSSTLNRLIKDRELYDRFLSVSSSLDEFTKKLASGKGTMGRLVEDESIYENLDSASKRFSALLQRIEEGKGVLGDLTAEGELDAELKKTVKDLNDLVKDIKENPKKYFKFSLF